MLALLCRLGDEARIGRFLREVVLSSYSGGENEALAAALTVVGPKAAGRFLPDLVETHFARRPRDTLALLRRLGEEHGDPASPDASWHGALRKGVRAALSALPGALAGRAKGRTPKPGSDSAWEFNRGLRPVEVHRRRGGARSLRPGLALEIDEGGRGRRPTPSSSTRGPSHRTAPCQWRCRHCTRKRAWRTPPPSRRCGAMPRTSCWRAAKRRPRRRGTGRSPPPVKCRCEHCAKLRAFCKDPVAETARFPLRQELRVHLQEIIKQHRLDLSHVTERRGRPFTLVCTKTRASHERRLAEYAEDVSNMPRAGRVGAGRKAGRTVRGRSRAAARGDRGDRGRLRAMPPRIARNGAQEMFDVGVPNSARTEDFPASEPELAAAAAALRLPGRASDPARMRSPSRGARPAPRSSIGFAPRHRARRRPTRRSLLPAAHTRGSAASMGRSTRLAPSWRP